MSNRVVGHLQALWFYPVKSMRGTSLDETDITLQGLQGDRNFAFVERGSRRFFPWVTAREAEFLLACEPSWADEQRRALNVRLPDGRLLDIGSPELAAELSAASGKTADLLCDYRGSFDVAPITLISNATVLEVGRLSGTDPDPMRFRMNFYVETGGEAFGEDAWVGRVLRIGDTVRVGVTERDKRCVMTSLAPRGGASAPSVLRAIAEGNGAYAGVYAAVLTPGSARVGDAITIEE